MIIDKAKVRYLMRKNGIKTQTELATLMGITKNQLSVMLSGKYDPIKSNANTLAKALNVDIRDIIVDGKKRKEKQLTLNIIEPDTIDISSIKAIKNYTVVELFAGAGGLALGLEQAGFNTTALVEIDTCACETLKINRPQWNIIQEDIVHVSDTGIKNYIDKNIDIDLLSGGYPCQAFSYAGYKRGLEDVRGTLFYYYAQILNELKPKMFLVENVRGLVSHDQGKTLTTMLDVFESIGYQVQWKVLNAWDYGVAQKRERIFIVGIRNDYNVQYKYPKPFDYKPVLRDVLKNVPESEGAKYPDSKRQIMDMIPPGGYWKDLPENIAKEYMGKSYYSGGGRTGMARRLSWDEPSLTLTCSPSQKQTERCHPEETRPFTTREYARIQSFPDTWKFAGSMSNVYKQIGNAVPVKLAKAVGLSIVATLNTIHKTELKTIVS